MIFSRRKYRLRQENRQFLDYIPPASILIGGMIFIVGTLLAVFSYQTPRGGYDFFNQYFSELGLRFDYTAELANGSTEYRYAPDNPDLFNVTLYASGFLMIPFFMFTYRQMRNDNRLSNFFLILATICGVAAGPFLIGVGIFDLSFTGDAFWQTHQFWVVGLYSLITITSFLWFFMLIASSRLPYHTSKWIWLDYILLVILVLMVSVNLLDGFGILLVGDIPLLNAYPIQTYQKLIAYLFFIYYGLVVGIRLTKTKYDNTPVEPDKYDSIYCTWCGWENPEDAPYCVECGAKL